MSKLSLHEEVRTEFLRRVEMELFKTDAHIKYFKGQLKNPVDMSANQIVEHLAVWEKHRVEVLMEKKMYENA